jgi:hypothetical protein
MAGALMVGADALRVRLAAALGGGGGAEAGALLVPLLHPAMKGGKRYR